MKVQAAHSADDTTRKNLQPCVIFIKNKMSVYVADIFATLLNHATKFKEVEIREKVSPVYWFQTGDGRNDLKYGSSRKIREIWQP